MGLVGGVPWRLSEQGEKANGEALRMDMPLAITREMDQDEEMARKEAMPREVCVLKVDFETFSYSVGCKGCKALLKETSRQGH